MSRRKRAARWIAVHTTDRSVIPVRRQGATLSQIWVFDDVKLARLVVRMLNLEEKQKAESGKQK
jgi:hypothetical protein